MIFEQKIEAIQTNTDAIVEELDGIYLANNCKKAFKHSDVKKLVLLLSDAVDELTKELSKEEL